MNTKSAVFYTLAFLVLAACNSSKIEVETETIQLRTVIQKVSANGKIQPQVDVKISPDVSGEIIELTVKEGDAVEKDQLIAVINPDIYQSAYNRAEAGVNNAKANLANSKARLVQAEARYTTTKINYDRNKALLKQEVISQADFEQLEAEYFVAKAEVDAAKETVIGAQFSVKSADATLNEAAENLRRTKIYAPITGTIAGLKVEQGERVVGTAQMAGTEMLRVANLNKMEVRVDVNENDIVKVHLGDTAEVEVDAYLNRKFLGIVYEIGNAANLPAGAAQLSTDQVTNFLVRVKLLPESYTDLIDSVRGKVHPFLPGMSATVDIKTKRLDNVIAVPVESVVLRNPKLQDVSLTATEKMLAKQSEDSKTAVFVLRNGLAELEFIETDIQDNNYIVVKSGINENDVVIKGPFNVVNRKLTGGEKVSIKQP
ncbi:MAG: efflux RND transporter periplasmic adaptor subunit [Luteibaculaceae bacterium]